MRKGREKRGIGGRILNIKYELGAGGAGLALQHFQSRKVAYPALKPRRQRGPMIGLQARELSVLSMAPVDPGSLLDNCFLWSYPPYMEVDMELSKKTTILFSPELYKQLSRLAKQKGVSLGELVRSACERQYGLVSREDRLEAVRNLAVLALPVGEVREMKEESVPKPQEIVR